MRRPSVDAYLALARWPNALLAAAGVLLGAWWVGWGWGWAWAGGGSRPVLLAALAAVALTTAANAWNDIADIGIDRVAHPARPLPSGRLSVGAARRLASTAALAGVALATASEPRLGALSVVVLALMYAYSPWLKRSGIAGNFLVALLASLPFLYGSWAVGRPSGALVLVLIAVPLHLAREIAKDLEDAPADAASRRTLPVTEGASAALAVLAAATLVFLLLLVPYAAARPRFAGAVFPAVALVLYAAVGAFRGRRGSPRVFKIAMLFAMAAFIIARP